MPLSLLVRGSLVVLLLISMIVLPVQSYANDEFDTILGRLSASYLKGKNEIKIASKAAACLSDQRAEDGTFKKITYAAVAPEPFSIKCLAPEKYRYEKSSAQFQHMDCLEAMAVAYRLMKDSDPNKDDMLKGVIKGLDAWFVRKPVSTNWWHHQIGQQLNLMTILVLLKDKLNVKENAGKGKELLLNVGLSYFHETVCLKEGGGLPDPQNLIWFAEQQVIRGVLTKSAPVTRAGLDFIEGELTQNLTLAHPLSKSLHWTTGRGIQADYSYHMHGPQLYNGSYGMGILDASRFAHIFSNTQFAFKPDSIETMAQYALQGNGMMIRRGMLDPGTRGRNIAKPGPMGNGNFGKLALDIAKLSPKHAAALTKLAHHIDGDPSKGEGDSYSFLGHKHFWNSDFTVHQRENYYTSVRMFSSRTTGTESDNDENLIGYWLPYGFNLISRDGEEYSWLPPVWDWVHLPGVTAPRRLLRPKGMKQPDSFVGGVSTNMYGVSGMRFETPEEAKTHLKAQKAWFFFDKEYVALGAGITSDDSYDVDTTLNQTALRSDVIMNGKKMDVGTEEVPNAKWVHHDEVGYVFFRPRKATIRSGAQTGTWATINSGKSTEVQKKNVFTLWVGHGRKPRNATYEYIVMPGASSVEVERYAKAPAVRVLSNTTDLQAVQHAGLGLMQAVFYSPGEIDLGDGTTLSVDKPAFIMIKALGRAVYDVTISSPVEPNVQVQLKAEFGSSLSNYKLSGGAYTGRSYSKRFGVHVAKGLFRVTNQKRIFQSDGAGGICYFREQAHLKMNGVSGAPVAAYATFPHASKVEEAESCSLSAGFFNLGGKTIYQSFGNGQYCQFYSVDSFIRAGGAQNFSNVVEFAELVPNMMHIGACK